MKGIYMKHIPSPHSVSQVIPANDWFFRFEHSGMPHVVRIAAWGLDHEGHVFGMVSASTADFDSPHLVKVSSRYGVYLHREDMTSDELMLVNQHVREAVNHFFRQVAAINVS